jgi:hypothetical protein
MEATIFTSRATTTSTVLLLLQPQQQEVDLQLLLCLQPLLEAKHLANREIHLLFLLATVVDREETRHQLVVLALLKISFLAPHAVTGTTSKRPVPRRFTSAAMVRFSKLRMAVKNVGAFTGQANALKCSANTVFDPKTISCQYPQTCKDNNAPS